MTMADVIAVMNRGRIEQAGSARELYDEPSTAFVANFLGQSNLVDATITGTDGEWSVVETHDGQKLRRALASCRGDQRQARVGVRPEKVLGVRGERRRAGRRAYQPGHGDGAHLRLPRRVDGVPRGHARRRRADRHGAEQPARRRPAAPDGSTVELSWEPEHTFVVAVGEDV